MALNIQAPLNTLGYGIVGLNTTLALERAGAEVALWPIGQSDVPAEHHDALQRMVNRTERFDPLAPSLRIWHQFDLAQHIGGGRRCAYPFFELNKFKPAELHHLRTQDIVFAPSRWAANVLFEHGICEPRVIVQPGVDPSIFRPDFRDPGMGTTTFLNIGKWEYRKGHDLLVGAFNEAFNPGDDVKLIMHCFNPCFRTQEQMNQYNGEWTRLYKNSRLGSKIEVSAGRFPTQHDVANLMRSADCGVFPSRGEGWNLEAAEMLVLGKYIILTDYSAHQDFATKHNSLLIEVTDLEDAHDSVWFDALDPVWQGHPGQWAELGPNQSEQLVEHLRWVHRQKQSGCLRFNVNGVEDMKDFTWDNTARSILAALEVVPA